MYYSDKLESLKDLFATPDVLLRDGRVVVGGRAFPIVDDVIVLLEPDQYPESLRRRLGLPERGNAGPRGALAEPGRGIQFTFGEEWKRFDKVLPEHEGEFAQYFDLVDLASLRNARVCDLGCGIGRWSYFLRDKCRELVLVDFSEAIFVARRNLQDCGRALFFMGDLRALPFRRNFADLLVCLGVLHHLPSDALAEVRRLRESASTLLVYLYYSLDNRPAHFRLLFVLADGLRRLLSRVRAQRIRLGFTHAAALLMYKPFLLAGRGLGRLGLARYVPLAEYYDGKSLERLRQDIYDRFFTGIEQRHSRREIMGLADSFAKVRVSGGLPYWHFVCER